jgi:hypothetical protein
VRIAFLLASSLSSVVLAACGETVGCDFREDSVNGPEDRCQERSGLSGAQFSGMCEGLQGEVVEGGCPREDAVAECLTGTQGDGSPVVDVYYEPMTLAEAEDECGDGELTEL